MILADRPAPNDPVPGCRDDGRLTVLSVTGRASGRPSDQVMHGADNDQPEYRFRLTAAVRIEEVVVQVCRRPPMPGPPAYCGEAQVHPVPVTTTG